jgi:multidrug resistance efflux pump
MATQQGAKTAVDKATQDLAKATAEVADAQKERDALRPKITKAEAEAVQAEKKAASSDELLKTGVISEKRAAELIVDRETTKKAFEDIKGAVVASEKILADAKGKLDSAQGNLDKAVAALKSADDLLAKSNVEKPAMTAKPLPAPANVAKPAKAQPTDTRIVMRRMPMTVRHEEPPAIPVKVFVDEKAMQSSEQRIKELEMLIADLKAKIAACKILAPASGRIFVEPNGTVSIQKI